MDTHYRNCKSVKRAIGALVATPAIALPNTPTNSTAGPSVPSSRNVSVNTQISTGPLSHLVQGVITMEQRNRLDNLLANAIHETGSSFSLFEHPSRRQFFQFLAPHYRLPSAPIISGQLLDDVYERVMNQSFEMIRNNKGGVLGIDGSTNRVSKSLCNVIVHVPVPLFIEYLRSDLNRETAENMVARLKNLLERLTVKLGQSPCFGFISDSCNAMRALRARLLELHTMKFTYSCSTHCLHNLSMDIGRLPILSATVKQAMFVSKTVKNVGLLRKLYESICMEMKGRIYAMVLFSPTRWTSVNRMLSRLLTVRSVLAFIPVVLLNERSQRGIDPQFELPNNLATTLMSASFWANVERIVSVLEPISYYIGLLESDTATLSDAYACFVCTASSIRSSSLLSTEEKHYVESSLTRRWNRIYSPVHALAIRCDPLYTELLSFFRPLYGPEFSELGNGDLNEQCHSALKLLASNSEHNDNLMNDFLRLSLSNEPLLTSLKHFQPRFIWGQLRGKFPHLALALDEVYRSPASTAGIERNHKITKRVLSERRCRLGELTMEKQVAVAHNASICRRVPRNIRHKGFLELLPHVQAAVPSPPQHVAAIQTAPNAPLHPGHSAVATPTNPETETQSGSESENQNQEGTEEWDDEAVLLEIQLMEINSAENIPDDILFAMPTSL
ncbi:Ribonuclease H-like protein [Gracilaria domingensis]|nr:Ribonuclease H-like protein [Gracilaria domingensis]